MELESLTGVYHSQLKDLRSVEKQLSGALKKLAEGATDERLKRVFTEHQAQTERQLERIEELIKSAGVSNAGHKCRGIAGIIEEAKPHLKA